MIGMKQVETWNAWFDKLDDKGRFYFYVGAVFAPTLILFGIKGGWLAILWLFVLGAVRAAKVWK